MTDQARVDKPCKNMSKTQGFIFAQFTKMYMEFAEQKNATKRNLRSSPGWCGGWGSCQDQDTWQLQQWHGNGCFGCLQWWWHNRHPGPLHLPSETPTSELYCRSVAFLSSHLSANPLNHLNCTSFILLICVLCINLTSLEILIYYCPTIWDSSIPHQQ